MPIGPTNKVAVIDLGTNTFQLGIAEINKGEFEFIYEGSLAPKIGKGGINKGLITVEAIERAIIALEEFKIITEKHDVKVENIYAIATSAVRNAKNADEFCYRIKEKINLDISIISGEKEADLICEGTKYAVSFQNEPYLIMDIGGGSVEFIIANDKTIFWKQSFEIGGQRLMEHFFEQDPILPGQVKKLQGYLEEKLIPLANAVHQYSPKTLVGSAGSFETLSDIFSAGINSLISVNQAIASPLPLESFYDSYHKFLQYNRAQRMNIPGMIDLRVDMIVVASVLIDYIIKSYQINEIIVSKYALKEGVLAKLANNELLNLN
jgi:exopolyphosphatase / guanosine-5'-triphosphate,3'-diphosphate pyrophosphatase